MTPIPRSSVAPPKYRPDIDGLRAVAILSVLVFHAFPGALPGGFAGVDVFFVISGFLISMLILENLERGTFSFGEFYARRLKRIVPALLLVLLASYAFGWFALLAGEYKLLGKHVAAGAAFTSNVALWVDVGYFDAAAETKPLLHLWSLAIEEQFYLVWPLLLWAAWRVRAVLVLTVVLAVVSFHVNLQLQQLDDHPAAFYFPHARFWELLAGSALAWAAFCRRGRVPDRAADGIALAGVVLLAMAFLLLDGTVVQGVWVVIPVLGAVFVIAAGPTAAFNRTVLAHPAAVWLGLVSFPLYLWHWPLLSFARILEGEQPSMAIRAGAVVAAMLLAWATYRFVERPIRGGRSPLFTPALVGGLGLLTVVGCFTFSADGFPTRAVAQRGDDVFQDHWAGWAPCALVRMPDDHLGGCRVLAADRPADVLVIGDSHAGHLGSGLKAVFDGTSHNVAVILHAACYPVEPLQLAGRQHFGCTGDVIRQALAFAGATSSVKTVVLSGYPALQLQEYRFHQTGAIPPERLAQNEEAFRRALDRTLTTLERSGKRVVFLLDVPELLKDPKRCVRRLYAPRCNIDVAKPAYLQRNAGFLNIVDGARQAHPGVTFVSAADVFCDATTCHGHDGAQLWYATRDHLSPDGSRRLIHAIAPLLFAPPGP